MTVLARKSVLTCSLLAAVAGLALPASADLPAAADRVPSNAGVVITVRDMGRFADRLNALGDTFPDMDFAGFEHGLQLLDTPGLKRNGSMAIALMPSADGTVDFGSDEAPMLIVVPVSDYNAFATGLGAAATNGVAAINLEDTTAYVKDIGGGFALVSPIRQLIDGYDGKAGKAADHKQAIGATGDRIASQADLFVMANIEAIRPTIEAMMSHAEGQQQMMAGMPGGEAATAPFKIFTTLMTSVADEGRTGFIGVGMPESGLWFDFGAQFKQGTQSYETLTGGNGGKKELLGRLPSTPFLFAMAVDTSAPGVRKIMQSMTAMQAQAAQAAGGANADAFQPLTAAMSDPSVEGYSFLMGASPAGMMGGLFVNTLSFVQTSKPSDFIAAQRQALEGATTQEGPVKITTTYTSNQAEVSGVKVDSWSMTMAPDPNDPNAMQVQMMQQMMFGPGGLGGMVAPVDNGVIMTMSQNTMLVTTAISAAKGQSPTLDSEASIKEVRAQLPENRVMEAYVGVKPIMDMVTGFMAMMGGEAPFEVPAKISPVAMAATMGEGGVGMRLYIPNDVLTTFQSMSEAMNGGMEGGDEPMDEGEDEAPRF